jgi:hypothetical protein
MKYYSYYQPVSYDPQVQSVEIWFEEKPLLTREEFEACLEPRSLVERSPNEKGWNAYLDEFAKPVETADLELLYDAERAWIRFDALVRVLRADQLAPVYFLAF